MQIFTVFLINHNACIYGRALTPRCQLLAVNVVTFKADKFLLVKLEASHFPTTLAGDDAANLHRPGRVGGRGEVQRGGGGGGRGGLAQQSVRRIGGKIRLIGGRTKSHICTAVNLPVR